MDTKKYEVLEKTVELSSLTKAAQELGLTQSGVSSMLAGLILGQCGFGVCLGLLADVQERNG